MCVLGRLRITGFRRKSSWRDRATKMRFSVLLNSWDNFFVTLPSNFLETWVIQSSRDLGAFGFCAKLPPRCTPQFSLLSAAKLLLILRVAISYGKSDDERLVLDYLFAEWKSIWVLKFWFEKSRKINDVGYYCQYSKLLTTHVGLAHSIFLLIPFPWWET